ncbi:hypothetical protein BD560DRAFT_417354, partial [Blakeslea trispora]
MSVEEFHDLFYIVAQAKLRDNIVREKNKKKPNYSALKAKTLAGQIPRGLYADMDKHANLGLRESANRFQNDNSVSRAIDLWRRYVQQNFDVVQESVSNPTTEATSSTQAIEPSSEELPTEPASFVVTEEYFEVCTAYFPSLIRDDLAPEVRQLFDTKLAELLPQTSNFISDFQTIMFMIMSCFRSHTFAVRNGKSVFDRSNGFQIQSIFPTISDSVSQFIQPKNTLHMACYESALTNYITNLSVMWLLLVLLRIHLAPTREKKHQEYIKSMKNASKERKDEAAKGSKTEAGHPTNWFPLLHQSRRRLIVRKERYRLAKYRQKSKSSSSAYMKQKWEARAQKSEKRIATYTKALETKEPKTTSAKRKQPSEPDVAEGSERPRKIPAIQHPSTASAEAGPSMLHTSRMELDIPTQPYEGKGKAPMNPQSDPKPVTFQPPMTEETRTIPPATPEDYASMDENDVVEEEDAIKDADDDAPRHRLNGLKGFIKSLLLRDEDLPNEQDLTGLCSDLNEKEAEVCLLILRRLKPYIPSKKNYSHIGYQLPF